MMKSDLLKNFKVFGGINTQCSKVAFNLKYWEVFLGSDDYGSNQVSPIPNAVIAFLTNKMTANFKQKLLESFIMDWSKGSHRLCG